MNKLWRYKRFEQRETQNLPWTLVSWFHNTLSLENILLSVIALLLVSLIWIINTSRQCPSVPSTPTDASNVVSIEKGPTFNHDLETPDSDEESESKETIDVFGKIHQSALNPFFVLRQQEVDTSTPSCTGNDQCSIRCSHYVATNFNDMIDSLNTQFKDCTEAELVITDTNFDDNVINSGWLNRLKMNIVHLSLVNNFKCNAAHIGRAAFSDDPFDSLACLTIVEPDLKYLEKKVFEGSQLASVEVRPDKQKAVVFEAAVFDHIRSTLTSIQLQQCIFGPEALRNITGRDATSLSVLTQLDLRYNVIQHLTSDALTNVGMVESIMFDSCAIETIDVDTFVHLGKLTQLFLPTNMLTTLPDKIFNSNVYLANINLEKNHWICDCNLAWLKEMYVKQRRRFSKALYCDGTPFGEADFSCRSTSTGLITTTPSPPEPSTETTRPPTSKQTTGGTTAVTPTQPPNPDLVLRVKCMPIEEVGDVDTSDAPELHLHRSNTSLSFILQDEQESVSCYMKLDGDIDDRMVFLLRDLSNDQFACYSYVTGRSTFKVSRLGYGKSYSGCLLTENQTDGVDPYNCVAIVTPLAYGERTWLRNDSRQTVIIGLVVSSLVFILLTIFIVFCCLRQHPKLIFDPRADMAVTRTSEYHEYSAPSYKSISDGYLTPRSVRSERYYEMPISPYRCRRKSIQVNYHSPGYVRRYSFMRRRNSAHNSEHVYEVPPPLPPNHPKDERYSRHPDMGQFM